MSASAITQPSAAWATRTPHARLVLKPSGCWFSITRAPSLTVALEARSQPAASPRPLDQYKAADCAATALPGNLFESKMQKVVRAKAAASTGASGMPVIIK
jgi:hypothetical protein